MLAPTTEIIRLVADCATVLTALGLIGIFWTLRHNRMDAWHRAHRLFMDTASPEKIKGPVFRHYDAGDAFGEWPADDQKAGWAFCGILEEICFLKPAIGRRAFWYTFGHPIGKAYLLLKGAIQASRDKDHRQNKWRRFERLGKSALKKFPEIERHYVPRAASGVQPASPPAKRQTG